MTQTEERWERLAANLTAAGVPVDVTTNAYPGGVSRSITLRGPDGTLVGIHDKWWNRNVDEWVGWEVHVENAESIVTRTWRRTKRRSEVVAAVSEALTGRPA
jgi:hypothetical protein